MGAMRSFGKGESSLEDKVQRELDKVLRRLNDLNGKPVVFQKLIQQFLSRCITSIVCNTDCEDDDPQVCVKFVILCKSFKYRNIFELWRTENPKLLPTIIYIYIYTQA